MGRLLDGMVEHRRAWFWAFLLVMFAAHLVAIYTEAVNWDEFVLLEHAAHTLRTGELQSGGRGGLGTVVLLPLVAGCEDPLAVAHAARWLWTGFTVALVAGLWQLVYRTLDGAEEQRWHAASVAVALLVCVPAFLGTSLQVRTDQPAVAFGLWAGVAILASRRRWPWALAGGALLGVGFLFSQKLVYVAALVGVLTVAETLLRDRFRPGRDLGRILLPAAAGGAVLLAWRALLPLFFTPPGLQSVDAGMNQFALYRATIGYEQYGPMAATLIMHLALLILVLRTSASGLWRDRHRGRALLMGAVVALGLAVGLFHAGAFPYFWMTLGLFPSVAVACGLEPLRERLVERGRWRGVMTVAWGFLVLQGLTASGIFALDDTQAEQRASFAFVDRTFPASAEGYTSHRGLFCGRQTEVRQLHFFEAMLATFGPETTRNVRTFIDSFRETPIAFLIDDGRLNQFPDPVTRFWRSNYRPYYASVAVPGWELAATGVTARTVDVFVAARYRWSADSAIAQGGPSLLVEGERVAHGEDIALERGSYRVTVPPGGGELLYAVDEERKMTHRPYFRSFNSISLPYLGEPVPVRWLLKAPRREAPGSDAVNRRP